MARKQLVYSIEKFPVIKELMHKNIVTLELIVLEVLYILQDSYFDFRN